MILIHCALLCEAQIFIEKFKLKKINSNPKIYANDIYLVCIGGIGQESTIRSLSFVFDNYSISTSFNIGISGCNDNSVNIGEIFCTNKQIEYFNHLNLISNDTPTIKSNLFKSTLYDMEGKYFLDISKKYLIQENIYIFKIVSDYLSDEILKKDYIKSLVSQHIKSLTNIFSYHTCSK